MAFAHGKDAVFSLDDSGGSPRDISAFVTNVTGWPEEAATHDTTTLSNQDVTRISGLKDLTCTVSVIFDATLEGYFGPAVGNTLSAYYGPIGSTGGNVKYSAEMILRRLVWSNPVDGPITGTLDLERTGATTRGTF